MILALYTQVQESENISEERQINNNNNVHTQSHLILCDPMHCSPPGSPVHGILQERITGMSRHFLLQGIFPTQRLNQADSLTLCHHDKYYEKTKIETNDQNENSSLNRIVWKVLPEEVTFKVKSKE